MIALVSTRISDVEHDAVGVDLEDHILRERRRCRAVVIFWLGAPAIAGQSILLEILFAEGSQAAHMNKSKFIILAARVIRSQIRIKRKIFIVNMQNRARRIIFVAIAFAVNVPIKIERVFVTLENVIEQLAVAVYHRFGELFFLIITYSGEMTDDENRLCALGVDLTQLVFHPDESFIAVITLVRIERRQLTLAKLIE